LLITHDTETGSYAEDEGKEEEVAEVRKIQRRTRTVKVQIKSKMQFSRNIKME
jgi:hypothetical protein